jgi:uncharacterized phage protein (TIGR01671 family)
VIGANVAIKINLKKNKMREIKFRAIATNTNEFVYSMTISKGTIKRKADWRFFEVDGNWIGVKPETIAQFTGRKCKNGVEVYEGDIVNASMPCDFNDYEKYIVGFHYGVFCFYRNIDNESPARQWKDGTNDWYSMENAKITEVIGNIYKTNI